MKSTNDGTNGLVRLGVPIAEARVYLGLHQNGPSEATPLSKVVDIPQSRIYSLLKSLVDRSFVSISQRTGKPDIYKAISYEVVIEGLREELENTLQNTSSYLRSTKQTELDRTDSRDYVTIFQGTKAVRNGLKELINSIDKNAFIFGSKFYSKTVESLFAKRPDIEIIRPQTMIEESLESLPPLFGELIKSSIIDRLGRHAPTIIYSDVDQVNQTAKSGTIIGHADESEEPIVLHITHKVITNFVIKVLFGIMDLLERFKAVTEAD